MKKRLTSFIFVLALSFSLFSVSASAEFTTSDSRTLTDIFKVIQYLNLSPASWQRNSVIGFLERILDAIPSNLSTNFGLKGGDGTNDMLDDIRKWTMFTYNSLTSNNIAGNLGDIQRNTLGTVDRITSSNTILSDIRDYVNGINGYATETTLSKLVSAFFNISFNSTRSDDHPLMLGYSQNLHARVFGSYGTWFSHIFQNLTADSYFPPGVADMYPPTLYSLVHTLQETLASEDDRQLAQNYQENRDQAQEDFLTGQTGPTSLGKGDFNNASQVGGALNDTFNMGGAAKVSDFLSGFSSAGSESQAWFSQITANNLNAVEDVDGTSGLSSFADNGQSMEDVDPDPYNMADIFSRYDWLEEVNMDD